MHAYLYTNFIRVQGCSNDNKLICSESQLRRIRTTTTRAEAVQGRVQTPMNPEMDFETDNIARIGSLFVFGTAACRSRNLTPLFYWYVLVIVSLSRNNRERCVQPRLLKRLIHA
jgi:hypothetical protein